MTQPTKNQSDADFAAQAFSTLPAVDVSAELMRRVAQIPIEQETPSRVWYWPFDRVWQPSLALAAVALMGMLTGTLFDTTGSSTGEIAELLDTSPQGTMPIGDDEELDNLLALALGQSWQESVWEPVSESTSDPSNKNHEDIHQ